jgi:hypothetical protein
MVEKAMSTRTTLVLLALLVLVAGVVYLLEFRKPAATTPAAGNPLLLDVSLSGITGLTVRDVPSNTQVTATRDISGTWWLGSQPADATTMHNLTGRLTSISIMRTLTPTANVSEYGLDKPSMTVQIDSVSGPLSFTVGDMTPNQGSNYTQKPGDTHVYLIDSGFVADLRQFVTQPPVAAAPTPASFVLPATVAP